MKKNMLLSMFAMGLAQTASAATAYVSGAHVVTVEPTYVPTDVRLVIDKSFGSCAAGSILYYTPNGSRDAINVANAQAILSAVLTAKTGQITISVGGDDSGCKAGYIIVQ